MKRRRYTDEQIVEFMRKIERSELTVAEACREAGVAQQSYYRWRRKFGDMSISEVRRLRQLERENARLKRLLAERDLELDVMRDAMGKDW